MGFRRYNGEDVGKALVWSPTGFEGGEFDTKLHILCEGTVEAHTVMNGRHDDENTYDFGQRRSFRLFSQDCACCGSIP